MIFLLVVKKIFTYSNIFVFQSVNFVHSFTPAAFRLAIPQKRVEASLVSVALSQSALSLIAWSLLLPTVVSFYIAVTVPSDRSSEERSFKIPQLIARLDVFIDALLACIMQFAFSIGSLNFAVKVAFALTMFFEFFFFNILRGEVVSFTQEPRIPASGCTYTFCGHVQPSDALGLQPRYKQDIFHEADVWNISAAEPAKSLEDCGDGTKRIAFYPSSMGQETLLLYLFLGRGFCGRRDIIDIKANSFKGKGLLLEEKLPVGRPSVELCTLWYIPWILRKALEHSLHSYSFFEKDDGISHLVNLEREFWSREDLYIQRAKAFLERNSTHLKQLYIKFNMWRYGENGSLTLSALGGSFIFMTVLILLSVSVLVLEKFKSICAPLLLRPSTPNITISVATSYPSSIQIRSHAPRGRNFVLKLEETIRSHQEGASTVQVVPAGEPRRQPSAEAVRLAAPCRLRRRSTRVVAAIQAPCSECRSGKIEILHLAAP